MGTLSFTTDLDSDIADEIERAIERGIRRGIRKIARQAEREAQRQVRQDDLLFTGELITSFETDVSSSRMELRNTSEHAAPQEYGVSGTQRIRDTPFSYDGERPPLSELIPWVQANLTGVGFDPWNRYEPDPGFGPDDDWQGPKAHLEALYPAGNFDGDEVETNTEGGGDGRLSVVTQRIDELREASEDNTELERDDSSNYTFDYVGDDDGVLWKHEKDVGRDIIVYNKIRGDHWAIATAYPGTENRVADLQESDIAFAETRDEAITLAQEYMDVQDGSISRPSRDLPNGFVGTYDYEFTTPESFEIYPELIVDNGSNKFKAEIYEVEDGIVRANLSDLDTGTRISSRDIDPLNTELEVVGRQRDKTVYELERGEDIIAETSDTFNENRYYYGTVKSVGDGQVKMSTPWENQKQQEVVNFRNYVGTREENPDLWATDVPTSEPVGSVPDGFDTDVTKESIDYLTSRNDTEAIVDDGDGNLYRVYYGENEFTLSPNFGLIADNPTIDGDEIVFDVDKDEPGFVHGDAKVVAVQDKIKAFENLAVGDEVIVDNRERDGRVAFESYPNGILKGKIDEISAGIPYFRIQYERKPNAELTKVRWNRFIGSRANNEAAWLANNLDPGDRFRVGDDEYIAGGQYSTEKRSILGTIKAYPVGSARSRNIDAISIDEIIHRNGVSGFEKVSQDKSVIPDNFVADFRPDHDELTEGEVVYAFDHRTGDYKTLTVTRTSSLSTTMLADLPYQHTVSSFRAKKESFPATIVARREHVDIPATTYTAPADIVSAIETDISPGDDVRFNEWDRFGVVETVYTSGGETYVVLNIDTEGGTVSKTLRTDGDIAIIVGESGAEVTELEVGD